MARVVKDNQNIDGGIEEIAPATSAEAIIDGSEIAANPAGEVHPVEPEPTLDDDPFSRENLRIPNSAVPLVEKTSLLTIPVRLKPGSNCWFMVHPDPTYTEAFCELQDPFDEANSRDGGASYILPPKLAGKISSMITYVRVYVCMSQQNTLFLWRFPERDAQGLPSPVAANKNEIATQAKKCWTRTVWNKDGKFWEAFTVTEGKAPMEPEWPTESFMELVRVAYRGRILTSLDDPIAVRIIRQRSGQKID